MQVFPDSNHPHNRELLLKAAATLGVLGGSEAAPGRILSLLCNPRAEPAEVSALIKHQPALCARVLRVANSAYFGQSRQVKTVERAFFVLGMDGVRGVAAAACLERTLRVCGSTAVLNMNQLLKHSIATAVAAECLAGLVRPGLAADAFIAGLL